MCEWLWVIQVQIANYDFKFAGVSDANGPNYMGGKAQIDISKAGKPEATLFAEKRFIPSVKCQ